MGPTRTRDVTAAAAVVAVISYLAVGVLYRWFPPITVWTGVSLLMFALAELGWGRYIRTKIEDGEIGVGRGRVHPLAVARTVVVAKASAWMGALVLGFWLGVLGYLLRQRSALQVAADDTGGAVAAAVSALALLAAALWLQNCCKSPPDSGRSGPVTGNQPG